LLSARIVRNITQSDLARKKPWQKSFNVKEIDEQQVAVIEQLFHFIEGICIFSTRLRGVSIFFWRYFAQ